MAASMNSLIMRIQTLGGDHISDVEIPIIIDQRRPLVYITVYVPVSGSLEELGRYVVMVMEGNPRGGCKPLGLSLSQTPIDRNEA